MSRRLNQRCKTTTTFETAYEKSVYSFKYERVEIDGDAWVSVLVRKRPMKAPGNHIGTVVHQFNFESLQESE